MKAEGLVLPQKWTTLRPEQLRPEEFLELTADMYGTVDSPDEAATAAASPTTAIGSRGIATHDRTAVRGVISPHTNSDNVDNGSDGNGSANILDTTWRSAMQSANSLKSSPAPK